MTTEIIVEKVDREAAEDYGLAIACRSMTFVEALARHRLAERDRVVAWLRAKATDHFAHERVDPMFALDDAADALERGDHMTTGQEEGEG